MRDNAQVIISNVPEEGQKAESSNLMSHLRTVRCAYSSVFRAATVALLVTGSLATANAQGKNPINFDAPPKLEIELGSSQVAYDDELEFKGVLCLGDEIEDGVISVTLGDYDLGELTLKPHYTGRDKVLSFYTAEGLLALPNGRTVEYELKLEVLGEHDGEFCYLLKLEVEGAELSGLDLSQPVTITGEIDGQDFEFTVQPRLEDDDDDDDDDDDGGKNNGNNGNGKDKKR